MKHNLQHTETAHGRVTFVNPSNVHHDGEPLLRQAYKSAVEMHEIIHRLESIADDLLGARPETPSNVVPSPVPNGKIEEVFMAVEFGRNRLSLLAERMSNV